MRRGIAPDRGFLIAWGMGLLALLWAAAWTGPAAPPVLASPSPATQDRIAASVTSDQGQPGLSVLPRDALLAEPGPQGRGQISFEHLARAQGLVGSVYWIMQDRLGFLWIGTSDGLSRYDGYTFKTYRQDPDDPDSLSEDHVFHVV
jgi:ligand-binding sensor domain-containing protein